MIASLWRERSLRRLRHCAFSTSRCCDDRISPNLSPFRSAPGNGPLSHPACLAVPNFLHRVSERLIGTCTVCRLLVQVSSFEQERVHARSVNTSPFLGTILSCGSLWNCRDASARNFGSPGGGAFNLREREGQGVRQVTLRDLQSLREATRNSPATTRWNYLCSPQGPSGGRQGKECRPLPKGFALRATS